MKRYRIGPQFGLAIMVLAFTPGGRSGCDAAETVNVKPIPVILDTDIGDDIDDTWALALMLKCPELDVRLVVGDQGKPVYRAKLIAKLLESAGRADVPVGIGLDVNRHGEGDQQAWVKDYDLKKYPGKIHEDGVQAIIDTIMSSDEPITLLAIGPLPNIRAALKREPAHCAESAVRRHAWQRATGLRRQQDTSQGIQCGGRRGGVSGCLHRALGYCHYTTRHLRVSGVAWR